MLALGIGFGLVLAGAVWWVMSQSASSQDEASSDEVLAEVAGAGSLDTEDTSDCQRLEALTGTWRFRTEVIGAGELAPLGMHGFYELEVTMQGCTAHAEVTKKGYTGRRYKKPRFQHGTAELSPRDDALGRGWGAVFDLRDPKGRGARQEFVFAVHRSRLVGTWRQRGERWDTSGRSGFLEGHKDLSKRPSTSLAHQPCTVRCALACDAAGRDSEVPIDALDGCRSACRADESEPAVCGDAIDLPAQYRVQSLGPRPTLKAHCRELSGGAEDFRCEPDFRIGGVRVGDLQGRKIAGDWAEAHLAFTDATESEGTAVRLAGRTSQGWFLTTPLIELPQGDEVTRAKIYSRSLGEDGGRRYVIGEIHVSGKHGPSAAFLACRTEDDRPRCVSIPIANSGAEQDHLLVTPLPGHALSISAPSTQAGSSLSTGLYRW